MGAIKHPTAYRFRHIRNGEVIWEQDWTNNALTDAGEQDILAVYFTRSKSAATNLYIGLINDSGIAETDTLSTMAGEPSGNGYARQLVTFGTPALDAGDYQAVSTVETFTASGGTIGPVTHAILTDVSSGTSGVLIIYVPLSATRTLLNGDSLEVDITAKVS
jgi:hypothetical protein